MTDEDYFPTSGELVTVSGETKEVEKQHLRPPELLKKFNYDPSQYVLYETDRDERIPEGKKLNLAEKTVFDAIPEDTAYGNTLVDPFLEAEVESLESYYEVDIDTEAENRFTHVIVRNFPIPADTYNKQKTDTMIRVPENYPVAAPDWVYVDTDLRLEGGQSLQKSHGERVDGWQALSWHINTLAGIEWEPYETDLKWYLETVVEGRLRQGD